MPLVAGSRLGSYEIVGPLGAGGMGEVYRARDAKLGRDVAIKVLPPAFAEDRERLARFQREAQVLASLNHANIGAIYDLQETENTRFLVLELVEGETLAELIQRDPLSPEETVETAKQIADALEAAHERGIIHRDLKPANIKVTPDRKVKVLDFGLAKMYEGENSAPELSHCPTLVTVATGGGLILGTVAYMSPEQARGRVVTKQTDIWAFGCILYEMLTGRLAFAAETVSDTIAKILKEDPDWSFAKEVPTPLRRTVDRCLSKDMRRRFRDAGDVRLELEEALLVRNADEPSDISGSRFKFLVTAVLIAILAIAGLWFRPADTPPAALKKPTWSGTLLGGPRLAYGPRISPDGRTIAFQAIIDGVSQVAVMNPGSGNWTALTHERDVGFVEDLSWATDGTKIYFSRKNGNSVATFSVPALGGEPRLIVENARSPQPLSDGSIAIVRTNGNRRSQLFQFRPDSGDVRPLNAALGNFDGGYVPNTPYRASPDGTHIVFFGNPADETQQKPSALYILDVGKNAPRLVEVNSPMTRTSGLALHPDGSILSIVASGDVQHVLKIRADGPATSEVLLTLTDRSGYLDVAPDGSIYIDQVSRPMQVIRFSPATATPEVIATAPLSVGLISSVVEVPDGRVLLTDFFDGRPRLLVAKPSGELGPFVDTEEQTRGPATLVGSDRVAFLLGRPPEVSIAIASIKDGRILQRFRIPVKQTIGSLSASVDGEQLFYTDAGVVWSISPRGGNSVRIGEGDAVAYDPLHRDLVVQLNGPDGVHLVRMPATGGAAKPIIFEGQSSLASPAYLGSRAVRADGKIAVTVALKDRWFFAPAVLDPASGRLESVPLRYDADFFSLSWNTKNEIVAGGFLLRSAIWRFRPSQN